MGASSLRASDGLCGESIPYKEINQKEDITEFKSRSLAKCLLNTFIPGGDSAAQSLIEAWEVA